MKYLAKFYLHSKFGRWVWNTFFTVKFRGRLLYSLVEGEKTTVGPFDPCGYKAVHDLPDCDCGVYISICEGDEHDSSRDRFRNHLSRHIDC